MSVSAGAPTDESFHRPPRAWPPAVPTEPVRVAAPPTEPPPPHTSLISTLFPVVGGVGIVGFALVYGNSAFLFVAGGMILLLLFFSFGMRWSQKRSVRKRAAEDARRYTQYLKKLDRDLAKSGDLQRGALARLYPEPARLWSMLLKREGVWERRLGDDDFLHVRLGNGTVPLDQKVTLDLGFNPLTEYQEGSLAEAQRLVGRRGHLQQAAAVVDLAETGVVTITGDQDRARAYVRALMLGLAAFRAPMDLRIVTAFDEEHAAEWSWGKWLPHQRLERTGGPPALAFARDAAELEALIEPELRPRHEQLRRMTEAGPSVGRQAELIAPELVVILDGYHPAHPANDVPAFRELLDRARRLRAVLILLTPDRELEPGHIDARLTITDRGRGTFERSGPDAPIIDNLEVDGADVGLAEAVARTLAPLRLKQGGEGERSLSAEVRLADLLADHRASRLTVPIALGDDGEPVVLDLKQAAENGMGPHGVLVGATGSGKSELLRSLVAGLAATHDPEELAFVLVDFKGGAAFSELSKLPHVAGLITNLQRDLSLVDRMRHALEGEQQRRQALLLDHGVDDVRAYRDRRRTDPSLEPLPDLLVIVDEFAELLSAKPDFIDLFVQIGRVGRSLGIHLLLSTQRLDEGRLRGLESHLRYRICLRTYSAVESKLVLGTPDAYLLPSLPGLGYLKVDTGLYRQFRAALVSAPLRVEPAAEPEQTPPSVTAFDPDVLGDATPAANPGEALDPHRTDLDVLIAEHGRGERVHQVWVDPLPEALPLDAVLDPAAPPGGPLTAVLGGLDLPAEQRKEPFVLDLAGAGGHMAIVGAPRTGKSTLLRTLVLSLAQTYTPDEVRFYGIDLGGGLLSTLTGLPHVGGVAGRLDREAVERVVRQLHTEVEDREERLREFGLESIAEARGRREEVGLADVVLLVDGWSVFKREFEELSRELEGIAEAGLSLGLHVVVAANRWAEIRPALLDNLGTRLELKLHDAIDSLVSKAASQSLPADVPGRGITMDALHFQVALPRMDGVASEDGVGAAVEAQAAAIAAAWDGPRAEPIRLLPALVDPAALPAPSREGLPIGLEERALAPVAVDLFGADPHLLVFGDAGSGKTSALRHVARSLADVYSPEELRLVVVDVRRSLIDLAGLPHLDEYCPAAPAAGAAVQRIAAELHGRVPTGTAVTDVLAGPTWTGPRYVVLVDDYDLVAGSGAGPLQPLLELLPLGRDVGLHVVLGRRVAGTARGLFEPVFGRLRELGTPGIILSGDPAEGPLVGGQKAAPRPPGRAQLVRRGERPMTVQLVARAPETAPELRHTA